MRQEVLGRNENITVAYSTSLLDDFHLIDCIREHSNKLFFYRYAMGWYTSESITLQEMSCEVLITQPIARAYISLINVITGTELLKKNISHILELGKHRGLQAHFDGTL